VRIGHLGQPGQEIPVVFLDGQTAVDVSSIVSGWSRETLKAGGLVAVTHADLNELPHLTVADYRIGAPLARPSKIVCIGLNYRKHAEETGSAIPSEPIIFMKSPDCLIGPFDDIEVPPGSAHTDYEVELAVVIGKQIRYAANHEQAMDAVLGFSVSQDVSERHWQLERGGTWDKGKSFPTFNPMGPWIDTDPVGSPQHLGLECSVNGERRQSSNTSDMIFTIAEVVHYVTQCMELFPGDIINTGTPSGVAIGMSPPQYLFPGDVVETTIENLGSIRSTCVAGG
jgi:2-keto-4-pentenoate hydratase/2-oxohepta-3-ene-1,7-dioic acid hydratase in catechol pathway